MRLTVNKPTTIVDKIDENGKRIHIEYGKCYKCDIGKQIDAIHKLGQLEDVEEELGIDLLTLIKAIMFGFFKKNKLDNLVYINPKVYVDFKNKCFKTSAYYKVYFKDYDKTWALTKEELL